MRVVFVLFELTLFMFVSLPCFLFFFHLFKDKHTWAAQPCKNFCYFYFFMYINATTTTIFLLAQWARSYFNLRETWARNKV